MYKILYITLGGGGVSDESTHFIKRETSSPKPTPGDHSKHVDIEWKLAIICVQSDILGRCSLHPVQSRTFFSNDWELDYVVTIVFIV